MNTTREWVDRQTRLVMAEQLLDYYTRSGGSNKYSRPFSEAASAEPEKFSAVTGQVLGLFAKRKVPVDYAVATIHAGHDPAAVIQLWESGVPFEFATV